MPLLIAEPHGPCAGVRRAIDTVELALARHGRPVHVFHEIVHNGHVVDELRSRGAVFVDQLEQVPAGAVVVFSAHGVSRAVEAEAVARGLRVIDATCPLVAKVHEQLRRQAALGRSLVLIGHAGHDEVVGTLGAVDAPVARIDRVDDVAGLPYPDDAVVAYVTQTTLSLDDTRLIIAALQRRYARLVGPGTDDICYATQHRQQAVRALCDEVDLVLVVGDRHSSNAQRLCEVARSQGVAARLLTRPDELDGQGIAARVGLSAAASTPESLVQAVITKLQALGVGAIRRLPGPSEAHVRFRLPEGLTEEPTPAAAGPHARGPGRTSGSIGPQPRAAQVC